MKTTVRIQLPAPRFAITPAEAAELLAVHETVWAVGEGFQEVAGVAEAKATGDPIRDSGPRKQRMLIDGQGHLAELQPGLAAMFLELEAEIGRIEAEIAALPPADRGPVLPVFVTRLKLEYNHVSDLLAAGDSEAATCGGWHLGLHVGHFWTWLHSERAAHGYGLLDKAALREFWNARCVEARLVELKELEAEPGKPRAARTAAVLHLHRRVREIKPGTHRKTCERKYCAWRLLNPE